MRRTRDTLLNDVAHARKLFAWLASVAFVFALIGAWTDAGQLGQDGARAQRRPQLPCRRADSGEDASTENGDSVDRVKATSPPLRWTGVCVATGMLEWNDRGISDIVRRTRTADARGPPGGFPRVARS